MRTETISDLSQVVKAEDGKILAYVSNGVLYYSTRIYKKKSAMINLKEFNNLEEAEQYFGVTFARPEEDNV